MITYRKELHFTCDHPYYDPDCHLELLMDQADAPTKKGMWAIAKKVGWTWKDNKCYCPSCTKKYYNNIMHPTKLPAAVKSKSGCKGRLAGCEVLIEGLIDIGYEMHIHDIEGRYPDGLDREKYKKQKIDELLNTLLDLTGLTVKGEKI